MSNDAYEVRIAGGENISDIVLETNFGFGVREAVDYTRPNGQVECAHQPSEAELALSEQLLAEEGVTKVTLSPGEVRLVRENGSDKDELTWSAIGALGAYCKHLRRLAHQSEKAS